MINTKIKGEISRFEGEFAIISFLDNEIKWPKKNLNEDSKAGDTVYLTLQNEKENELSMQELARTVLNEVIKDE